jgi:hypothetical protein
MVPDTDGPCPEQNKKARLTRTVTDLGDDEKYIVYLDNDSPVVNRLGRMQSIIEVQLK